MNYDTSTTRAIIQSSKNYENYVNTESIYGIMLREKSRM